MQNKKIRLYSKKDLLNDNESIEALLFPFWEESDKQNKLPNRDRFVEWNKSGKKYFSLVDNPKVADFFVLPTAYKKGLRSFDRFIDLAKKNNKKVIVFFNSDSDEKIPYKDQTIVFRTSFYRSKKQKNEFAIPGWSEDFKKYTNNKLATAVYSPTPSVCYCGYSKKMKDHVMEAIGLAKCHVGKDLRAKAMKVLKRDENINTNFLIRDGYWGGLLQDGKISAKGARQKRKEYVENMLSCAYVLTTRGGGNFSYRLYEAMSLGRIPLFVNTDCVLPYEKYIDWKGVMVWVEENEIDQIGEKLLEFHKRFDKKSFVAHQKKIRKIWEEWIKPVGFFRNLWRII